MCSPHVHIFPQINDQFIVWQHLQDLYKKLSGMAIQSKGLNLVPKLKQEHVKLTSYARMRVDLAAQVNLHVLFRGMPSSVYIV